MIPPAGNITTKGQLNMIGTYHSRGRCTDTFSGDVCLQGICFAILWVSEIDDFYLIHQSMFEERSE